MIDIEMQPMSPEFFRVWAAAGQHLQGQIEGGLGSWLKSYPYPPFLEHFSFRLGNQLFFIRVEDAENEVSGPSSRYGLRYIANANTGYACLLTMRNIAGIGWTPTDSGWGLVDLETSEPVNPILMVTDEKIEMTEWELQDMGVQIVRDYLESQNYELMSWQGNPHVDPSIWFVGETGPEWVVVRVTRYPTKKLPRPDNWDQLTKNCSRLSTVGHFASVSLLWANHPAGELSSSLPRGERMIVSFEGLE